MDQIHFVSSRLSPPLASWVVVALLGLVANYLTLRIIRRRMLAPVAKHSAIHSMLMQNGIAEATRGAAQLVALVIAAGYLTGVLQGDAVAWALVVMNATKVTNSINEYVSARYAGTFDDVLRQRLERLIASRRAHPREGPDEPDAK